MNSAPVAAVRSILVDFARHLGLPSPDPADEIAWGDLVARGGGGSLHALERVANTRPAVATLLKIHDPRAGSFDDIGASMGALHAALTRRSGTDHYTRLKAIPYWVGDIIDATGDRVLVTLMADLRSEDYEPFADYLEGTGHKKYRSAPQRTRLDLAASLAECCTILEGVNFIHGDLNPENVMISPSTGGVQIIDFDGGVVVTGGSERPRVGGKADEFLPPEVKRAGTHAAGPIDLSKFDQAAERWSIGMLMGWFIYAVNPLFFLKSISSTTVDAYATAFTWPEMDLDNLALANPVRDPLFHRYLLDEVKLLPLSARDLFQRFFHAGAANPADRPTAAEWVDGLRSLKDPPIFDYISVQPTATVEGEEVELSWTASNTRYVEIDDVGRRGPSGTVLVPVSRSGRIRLRAVNDYATTEGTTPPIRVFPAPTITELRVPSAPTIHVSANLPLVRAPATSRVSSDLVVDLGRLIRQGPTFQLAQPLRAQGAKSVAPEGVTLGAETSEVADNVVKTYAPRPLPLFALGWRRSDPLGAERRRATAPESTQVRRRTRGRWRGVK